MARPTAEHAERFPSSFSFKNYEACAIWGMKDWLIALNYRRRIFEQIKFQNNSESQMLVNKLLLEPLNNSLQFSLSLAPVKDQNISEFFSCYDFCDGTEQGKKYTSWHNALVNEDKSINDLTSPEPTLVVNELSAYELIELRTFPAWKLHKEIRKNGTQPIGDRYFISVDLKSTDDQLVAAFENWVKRIRREIETSERLKITEDMPTTWHKLRYLALIDVYIWSQAFGDVTYRMYGDMIYGQDFDSNIADPENIRKTTLNNALNLISIEYVSALERLIKHSSSVSRKRPSKKQ